MKNPTQRINNIIGQMEGLKRMIEGGRSCGAVLIQAKAIRSGLDSLVVKIIKNSAGDCIKDLSPTHKRQLKKLIDDLIMLT